MADLSEEPNHSLNLMVDTTQVQTCEEARQLAANQEYLDTIEDHEIHGLVIACC